MIDAESQEAFRSRVQAFLSTTDEAAFAGMHGVSKRDGLWCVDPPRLIERDPLSAAYAEDQLTLYRLVSGRDYDPLRNELAQGLEFQSILRDPWPFCSRDLSLVGHYFMGVGQLLRILGRKRVESVLEYGPGWGYTTQFIARSGCQVSVVDAEPLFLRYVEATTTLSTTARIVTHHGLFGDKPNDARSSYDAIVFFECFHHCFAHRDLLDRCRDMLPVGGRILFGNENINARSPYPWGLRLDRHSLGMIASLGWMELGFTEDYFVSVVKRAGFTVEKHAAPAIGEACLVYEATKA